MSRNKVQLVRSGVHALLNSQEVAGCCSAVAAEVAGNCGPNWAVAAPHKTGQRVAVNVYPTSRTAARENEENDTARRAVQSMEILL